MDPASIQNLFRLLSEISHHQGAIAKASSSLETISRCKAYKRLGAVKFFFVWDLDCVSLNITLSLSGGEETLSDSVEWLAMCVCVCVCAGSESGESESEH